MAKNKTQYFCKNCGAQSAQWIGRCPSCGEWNTFEEEVIVREETPAKGRSRAVTVKNTPKPIDEVSLQQLPRVPSTFGEFDRVLGGGIVAGSIVLLGGEPGIGKSTLLLQMALNIQGRKILYVSGEESEAQLKMRAARLSDRKAPDCYVLTETAGLRRGFHFPAQGVRRRVPASCQDHGHSGVSHRSHHQGGHARRPQDFGAYRGYSAPV